MKKTIKDYNLSGKRVMIRCDFNVPVTNGKIDDDNRIRMSLKTINYAIDNNAKVILLSHLGKIKEESDKEKNSLEIVSVRLSELINRKVIFSHDTKSEELTRLVNNLKEKDVLLIENTRYEDLDGKKESSCDMGLAKYWASLGDIFINDAYGTCHRAHASNVGIAKLLPNGIGFLVEEEITKIDSVLKENTHPFIIIMGGKKVSDKIPIIKNLINKCDLLLIGGAMAFTFLKAKGYNVGNSIVDVDNISFCKDMLEKYPNKILLPIDIINENNDNIKIENIKDDIGYDIGKETIKLYCDKIKDAKRIIVNGPMGMFENENYENGTRKIYECISENNIKTIIGGGDSASSVKKLGFDEKFYHISTGGGATLEYLSGEILPGISVIEDEEESLH